MISKLTKKQFEQPGKEIIDFCFVHVNNHLDVDGKIGLKLNVKLGDELIKSMLNSAKFYQHKVIRYRNIDTRNRVSKEKGDFLQKALQ